ncbi:hypothetical protein GUJ93_ZPchr0013g35124 [Zizania palustris]|uniref:Uncharacterized protein n=1 Tax=Zizania palustris TaxID=103762 RepID=A0A8J5X4T7_ZIZPA|nr:hypothetical protein GUJ93_ZPchr0013g35124 [Zizania palustris]
MDSATKSCIAISLILLSLLAPIVHGARHVPGAKGTGSGEAVTSADGHGHGYSSHMSHNPNGNSNDGSSGTPAVDPHAVAARGGHHHRGAATRTAAAGYSRLQATCTFLGAAFLLLLS